MSVLKIKNNQGEWEGIPFLSGIETDPIYTADKPNIALKSEIPTKTSELTNDSGFITDYTETDPTVPSYVKAITETDISNWNNKAEISDIPDISTKQDTLVSGTNIKTINGQSILGEGNITIEGGGSGSITLDTEMSDTSENAVQNKVIKKYVDNSIPKLVTLTQAEYDALVSAGTVDDNTYYFIPGETGNPSNNIANSVTLWKGTLSTEGEAVTLSDSVENYDYICVSWEYAPANNSYYRPMPITWIDVEQIKKGGYTNASQFASSNTAILTDDIFRQLYFSFVSATQFKLEKIYNQAGDVAIKTVTKIVGIKEG